LEGSEAARELLLADHAYLTEAFLKNEEIGETRVNWLIGIVTGAAGGLTALITKGELPPATLRLVVIGSLFSLLAFGLVTLFRIITRNMASDGYKHDLDKVRQLFSDRFDSENVLTNYHPFGPSPTREKQTTSKEQTQEKKTTNDKQPEKPMLEDHGAKSLRKFGGLAHTVAAINALLAGGLTASVVNAIYSLGFYRPLRLGMMIVSGFIVTAASFLTQFDLVTDRERAAKKALRQGRVTHAGGVVFRRPVSGVVEYLIVASSKEKEKTVLPKGHVEKNENAGEAALREVSEEAGVSARLIRYLDTVEYEEGNGKERQWVIAKFYLMEGVFETKGKEDRTPRWLSYDLALKTLSFPEAKYLLTLANRYLEG
jgi:8-oxo-dGTP pyrophosphatase MutT (NUDIX family)